jgi:hypothetical protein
MGDIQTYFYLALISLVLLTLSALFIWVVFRGLRQAERQSAGSSLLILWLIGGAVTVALLFFVVGTAGVLYGFIRYGA